MEDKVNHPKHYTNGKVECIVAIEATTEGLVGIAAVCTANILKYVALETKERTRGFTQGTLVSGLFNYS